MRFRPFVDEDCARLGDCLPERLVGRGPLGASPDRRTGMLYSISAMTSFGHAGIYLDPRWQMMGALEALNGMMLFLFSVLQTRWPSRALDDDFLTTSSVRASSS
jgi:hypothetical protein